MMKLSSCGALLSLVLAGQVHALAVIENEPADQIAGSIYLVEDLGWSEPSDDLQEQFNTVDLASLGETGHGGGCQQFSGVASVYGLGHGAGDSPNQRTASGGRLNTGALTAAMKNVPMGSRVTVTNLRNGRSVSVVVNDRGPFVRGRVIDLTPAGARALGFSGLTPVRIVKC